ncbi:pentapeptide repeat-containing protein [Thermogemmatispora carboxidivorans]|uniref:pentapeptide repeat-containing protein n=1 Tax=Thermogemmatispora carboxidivorans TaxID=1382306 RepID=UPI00069A4283|nr:pentapeptide repeat-containing protein [Thermogemmatispora carboxidivorans]
MTRTLPDAVSRHLQDHERWLASSRTQGQRWQATGLDLSQLDLSGRPLQEAFLRSCSFAGSLLAHTNLSGAVLSSSHFLQAQAPDASLAQALCWQTLWRGAMLHRLQAERADFSEADFSEADLSEASLRLARFDHARLLGTSFRQANLQQASFFQADLTGADLTGARLWGASFFGAIGLESVRADWIDLSLPSESTSSDSAAPNWLDWFILSDSEPELSFLFDKIMDSRMEFGSDRLTGESVHRWLQWVASHQTTFSWQERLQKHEQWIAESEWYPQLRLVDGGLDLHGLDLSHRRLSRVFLPASNFNHALLRQTQLDVSYLASCSFLHASLDLANLSWSLCWKSRFRQATLRRLDASHSSFWLADLSGADLTASQLSQADFSYATLTQARLCDCQLEHACFTHADLSGADLTGARLWHTSFAGSSGLESVRADWLLIGPPEQLERLTGETARRWLLEAATAPPS